MTAFTAWGVPTLMASAALMIMVLAVRTPLRNWAEPRLGYMLWAIPAARLILPPLPDDMFAIMPVLSNTAAKMPILFTGPYGAAEFERALAPSVLGQALPLIWVIGAVSVFSVYATRHFVFCRGLRASGTDFGGIGATRIIAADVAGPLAFGVFQRFIAVPRTFAIDYDASERNLALAHEFAHHNRGDLIANWVSILVLAIHWWNPIAWIAIRAFREDQEFAADAHVLAARGPDAVSTYAHVLAKAAGISALPACNLNARSNLKGRLMMLGKHKWNSRRNLIGGVALAVLGSSAIAATATTTGTSGGVAGKQAVTIGVKPDGSGSYALIIGRESVAPGSPLPGGLTLPADFTGPTDCDLERTARPVAMVIKGTGETQTYTVMCASAAAATVRVTMAEGLASLKTMRASVATQSATEAFPEAERAHALGAIDRSIREVEATLSAIG